MYKGELHNIGNNQMLACDPATGETPSERSDPLEPRQFSNWPDYRADGRPRSATVVVVKRDGGVIGT